MHQAPMFRLLQPLQRHVNTCWGRQESVEGSAIMPNTPKHEGNQPQTLAETWGLALHKVTPTDRGQHDNMIMGPGTTNSPDDPHFASTYSTQKESTGLLQQPQPLTSSARILIYSHNHDWPGRRSVAIFLHLGIQFGIQTCLGSTWVRLWCINLCSGETLCLAARRSYRHCHYLPNIQMSREKWLQIFSNLTCETYYVSRPTWSTFCV